MKYITHLLAIFLLISCGTDHDPERIWNYKIFNNSSSKIEIIPYYNGIKNLNKKITLSNFQIKELIIKETKPIGGSIRMSDFFYHPESGNLSHLEIVFNNSKKTVYEVCSQTFNCNLDPRNIFNIIHNNELIEVYTITPEDYQNATDCGGNCN